MEVKEEWLMSNSLSQGDIVAFVDVNNGKPYVLHFESDASVCKFVNTGSPDVTIKDPIAIGHPSTTLVVHRQVIDGFYPGGGSKYLSILRRPTSAKGNLCIEHR